MRRFALVLVACAHPAVKHPLPPFGGEREIENGDVHRYEAELTKGQVMLASVEQLGADVVVTTYGPDGKKLAAVDSPTGAKGVERVQIDATMTGRYRIEVAAFPGQRGTYRAKVDEIVTAEEMARRDAAARAEIEKFFAERKDFVDAFVAWAKTSAVTEVASLDRVVGKARVVVLAEAEHGIHEYLAYRNRVAKYLVEKQGFTALVVESGFTETTAVDDYVTGASKATAKEVAPYVFSWGVPAALRDNVELVEWLRAYNQTATRKVHVYGMDLSGPREGLFKDSGKAIDAALAYLHDDKLSARFAPLVPKFSVDGYLELTDAQRAELTTAIADLLKAFEARRDSSPAYKRAQRNAAVAAVLEEYFRQTRAKSSKQNLADPSLLGIRDAAMGANVMWALEQEGPSGRVLVYTANAHARRGPIIKWPTKVDLFASMGQYLAKMLKDQLVVIGSTHGNGKPSATLDWLLARVGPPEFVVDLRAADATVRPSLDRDWDLRLDGWEAWGAVPRWTVNPIKCFDALAFTRASTPAELVK